MTTLIEWTDETWNPVTGCTKVSPGCDHCYAERITERFHGKGSFEKVELHEDRLGIPLHWRKPRMVFVNSMSDLFHPAVALDFLARVWDIMVHTPWHTYQILTKRPDRMAWVLGPRGIGFYGADGPVPRPQPNVWLGTSVETQKWAAVRIPKLLQTPAAVRFLSCEPLLGPLDLSGALGFAYTNTATGERVPVPPIDWCIVGGESGPGARPMHPAWVRSLRDQCGAVGVPFFFKQWGEWSPGGSDPRFIHNIDPTAGPDGLWMSRVGKKRAGRELDGRTWDEMP